MSNRDSCYENAGNPALLALVPEEARSILDVGCGAGDNARLLAGRTVYGVTVSKAEAELARPACQRVFIADVETDDLPIGEVDALLLSHVVEHLIDPRRALTRLRRHLRPGGWALVAIPNMAFWRVRVRLARGDWRRDDGGPLDRTHLHFWSHATAPSLFDGTPFTIVETRGADPALPLWPLRRLWPSAAAALDRTLGARAPDWFALQTLLVARAI